MHYSDRRLEINNGTHLFWNGQNKNNWILNKSSKKKIITNHQVPQKIIIWFLIKWKQKCQKLTGNWQKWPMWIIILIYIIEYFMSQQFYTLMAFACVNIVTSSFIIFISLAWKSGRKSPGDIVFAIGVFQLSTAIYWMMMSPNVNTSDASNTTIYES